MLYYHSRIEFSAKAPSERRACRLAPAPLRSQLGGLFFVRSSKMSESQSSKLYGQPATAVQAPAKVWGDPRYLPADAQPANAAPSPPANPYQPPFPSSFFSR